MPPSLPIPSASVLEVLRQLANGSAITAGGGICGVAGTTYETHRRICISERILERKRKLHACPRYHGSAERVARMMEMAEAVPFGGTNSLPKEENNGVVEEVPQEGIESKGTGEYERGDFEPLREWRPLHDEACGILEREKILRSLEGTERNRSVPGQLNRGHSLSDLDLEVDAEARRYQRRMWNASRTSRSPELSLPHYIIPKRFRLLRGPVGGAVEASKPESVRKSPSNRPIMPKWMESFPHYIIPKRFRVLEGPVGEAVEASRPESARKSPSNRPITPTWIQSLPHDNIPRGFRLLRKPVEPVRESPMDRRTESTIAEEISHQIASTDSETLTDDVLHSPTQEYFRYLVSQAQWNATEPEDYIIIGRLHASDYSGALHEHRMRRDFSCASGSTPTPILHALFIAALLANEPGTAEVIFEELEKDARATPIQFNFLLSSYHLARDEEKIAKLYVNYSDSFQVLRDLYSPLLAALLNTKRLAAAEDLIEDALDGRSQIKLEVLQDLCASFLSKLWVNSRNLRLVETWFDKLCTREGDNLITFKLYNSIIQACVESYEVTKAHHYYGKMISTQNLSPDIRTHLLMLELDASKGNWDAVKMGLQELHDGGVIMAATGTFTRSFDRLFQTYKMHHNASSAWNFISDGIQKYGLVPDQTLSNNLLSACARDGNLDLVAKWFNLVSKKGWNIVFNGKTFAKMFEWYWRGTKVPYEHLCVLLHACVKLLGNASLGHRGHRMLSHDVIDTVREAVMWEHRHSRQGPSKHIIHQLSHIESQYSDSTSMIWKDWRRDPDQLRKKMLYTMSRGDMRQVVEYYQQARAAGGLIKRIHVQLAVQASIKETGTTEQASSLIREAADVQGSQSVIGEILAQNLKSWEPWEGTVELKDALENYYTLLERDRVKIDERMIVVAANRALEFNLAGTAIGLLMWMHESRWSKQTPLGISPMTVLLRAYIKNRNIRGVEWVINHVLDTNIPIDSEFYYQVWKARQQLVWKKMTERQISGEDPLKLELRTWSTAMDIWVRDVVLRQKHAADERLQRGFEIINLANKYGGLGHLWGREAEEVLELPLRVVRVGDAADEELASSQTFKTLTDEMQMEIRETWMRSTGWTPSGIPIHYVPRQIQPLPPGPNLRNSPKAMRKRIWALKTRKLLSLSAERRAISELRAIKMATRGQQLKTMKMQ